ncbi:MAG: energy transducer TonB [Zoogloea sp.]|nr:energy transducer TonB [Zoogloea sp.]
MFAIVAADRTLRLLGFASVAGQDRDAGVLDGLAWDRLSRCRSTNDQTDILLEVGWDFSESAQVVVTTRPARPADLRNAEPDFERCSRPVYPREATRANMQGTSKLALLVDAEGQVVASRVAAPSGFPLLDQTAVEAISKCPFRPARLGDDVLAGLRWTTVSFVWKLE